MEKRWLVFSYDYYYPSGGINDLILDSTMTFDKLMEEIRSVPEHQWSKDNIVIVDHETMQELINFERDQINLNFRYAEGKVSIEESVRHEELVRVDPWDD